MIQQCARGPKISRALGFWEQFQSAVKMHYNIYSYLTSSKLLNAHVQLLSVSVFIELHTVVWQVD